MQPPKKKYFSRSSGKKKFYKKYLAQLKATREEKIQEEAVARCEEAKGEGKET